MIWFSIALVLLPATLSQETRQATGVKVGEVTESSAVVWMRVTERASRHADGIVRRGRAEKAPPLEAAVDALEGSAPGIAGRVRLRHGTTEDLGGAQKTEWVTVTAERDFTHQFRLSGLKPATKYHYAAETAGLDGKAHAALRGSFETAPPKDRYANVTFTVITGQMYADLDDPGGFLIYDSMLDVNPKFIVPTGDTVYYDSDDPRATTVELARYHWHRMYSMPRLITFHLRTPGYWEKDDHDTVFDDCWPTMNPKQMLPMTFDAGQRIFREQVPMGEKTYRTFRWGEALQVWLTEGRDFRSPNRMPDGPGKTIWGEEQRRWLKNTIIESDADWKVLVSPTPIVGPDRKNKHDNHSNVDFAHEGNEFREWVLSNVPENFFVACGDRHWQYHSVHPGSGVHEFASGPVSDQHAGGSPGEDPKYHRFHRVNGGFLSVSVARRDANSVVAFRLHDVAGKVVYEFTRSRRAR